MAGRSLEKGKPFTGFLFCFTGIKFDFREELSTNVRQLGGLVSRSYTSAVTHLIAKSKTSEKFEAAVRLNIHIFLPSFVKECHTNYKNNLPIIMEKLILKHSFFPLRNKYVTISGFEEDRLRELEEIVQKLGGGCKESFSSLCDYFICDISFTILITILFPIFRNLFCYYNPSKDEQIQVGAKGGIVHKAAWLEGLLASIPTTTQSSLSSTGIGTGHDFKFPASCIFSLSGDFKSLDKIALKEKLIFFGAKVANEFNRPDATHYFIASTLPSKCEKEEIDSFVVGIKIVNQEWLERCVKSSRLLAPSTLNCEPNLNEATLWNGLRVEKPESGVCASDEPNKPIFRGIYFSMVGLDPGVERFAQEAIALRGGEIVKVEILASPRIIILPFRGLEFENNELVGDSEISSLVTAYWLQRCMDCNKLIDPSGHVLYSPLSTIEKLEGFSNFHITVTGFSGMKRVLLMGLARSLGANWTESMTHRTTHLICKEFKGGKYDLALKKEATIVTEAWLFHVAETRDLGHASVLQAIPKEHNPHFSKSKPLEAPSVLDVSAALDNSTGDALVDASTSFLNIPSNPSSILKGVVFFLYPSSEVSLWFDQLTRKYDTAELIRKAHAMGAISLNVFEVNRVTHLIVSGTKDFSASKTFRCAVQRSIIVVAHSWMEKCYEAGRRLDELDFLYKQAPRTRSSLLRHAQPKIEKVTPCQTQQNVEADQISIRLHALIKETYKRKVQDHENGALNLGPKINEMGDGHVYIEEPVPEDHFASLTLGRALPEEQLPSQSFCVKDMKQVTRERRHLLGFDAPPEISKATDLASKRPRTRSALKAIIDLNSPPNSSFSSRRKRQN